MFTFIVVWTSEWKIQLSQTYYVLDSSRFKMMSKTTRDGAAVSSGSNKKGTSNNSVINQFKNVLGCCIAQTWQHEPGASYGAIHSRHQCVTVLHCGSLSLNPALCLKCKMSAGTCTHCVSVLKSKHPTWMCGFAYELFCLFAPGAPMSACPPYTPTLTPTPLLHLALQL